MKRSSLIVPALFLTLCLVSILGCGGSSGTLEEHPMRFAVIGDRTGHAQPGIYGQVVEEIQRMKPDLQSVTRAPVSTSPKSPISTNPGPWSRKAAGDCR